MTSYSVKGLVRLISFCICFMFITQSRAELSWFIHLTPEQSPIQTEIILSNNTPNPGEYVFNGSFDVHSLFGERVFQVGRDSLGPLEIISHSANIKAWVRYSGPSLISPLTLPASADAHNYFRFENPGAELDWKGLVVYNTFTPVGERDVQLVFRDQYGYVVQETRLTGFSELGKYSRLLPEPDEAYASFEIISEQPVSVLLLSGTKPVDGKYMLNHHVPVVREANHLEFTWIDEEGAKRSLTITPRTICTDSGACAYDRSEILNPILEKVQELSVLDTRAVSTKHCSVNREVKLYWFGRENLFTYCKDQEDVPDEALIFTNFLMDLYQEIL